MKGKELLDCEGLGVGSVTKAVVTQEWGPEFGSLEPLYKRSGGHGGRLLSQYLGGRDGGGRGCPWGKLAKASSQIGRVWVYWEIRFRMIHQIPMSWRPRWNKRGKGHQPCRTSLCFLSAVGGTHSTCHRFLGDNSSPGRLELGRSNPSHVFQTFCHSDQTGKRSD